jgi:NTE family protein
MSQRALVLGGGGLIGIAWETGVLLGLREEGLDVRAADLVVGTSAGSMVGVRVADGHDLAEALEPPEDGLPWPEGGFDLAVIDRISQLWKSVDRMTPEVAREIGTLALAAPTCEAEAWIARTGGACGVVDWPATDYVAVVVDVESGAHRGIDRSAGVALAEAIAASCAIPGMFPPIAFDGRRWMDGGVRSGTSADLVLDRGATHTLIVAPMCARVGEIGPVSERAMRWEMEVLEAAGRWVEAVTPGAREAEIMGSDLMNPAGIAAAQEAGFEQGRRLARSRAGEWWA